MFDAGWESAQPRRGVLQFVLRSIASERLFQGSSFPFFTFARTSETVLLCLPCTLAVPVPPWTRVPLVLSDVLEFTPTYVVAASLDYVVVTRVHAPIALPQLGSQCCLVR